jgi:uncharacterized membrane protein YccC
MGGAIIGSIATLIGVYVASHVFHLYPVSKSEWGLLIFLLILWITICRQDDKIEALRRDISALRSRPPPQR